MNLFWLVMVEKNLILEGKEYSYMVPENEDLQALKYSVLQASSLIYLNSSKELKAKTNISEIQSILELKFMAEDVHNFRTSDGQILDFLERKSSEFGYAFEKSDLEEILHLENLYLKLIKVIPD